MSEFRTERDSMGEVQVPAKAYYGAQTQRAVENFPISGWELPPAMIHAMGLVKYACGVANRDLTKLTGSGKNPLSEPQVDAMLRACREVAEGKLDDAVDVIRIDAKRGVLKVKLSATELKARRKAWPGPRETSYGSGAIWKYAQTVGGAKGGAVTHPGGAGERHIYADL